MLLMFMLAYDLVNILPQLYYQVASEYVICVIYFCRLVFEYVDLKLETPCGKFF